MKKIIVCILCALLMFAMPLVAFAEGNSVNVAETVPEETPPTFSEEADMVTEQIVAWITDNVEEIGVVITLISYGIVLFSRLRTLNKSAGTINNNAITISKTSNDAIAKALTNMENASSVVSGYEERITAMLEAFKTIAEDRAMLGRELVEIKNYLKIESKSNIEFANELAELIALSCIPNYKKENLGSRHVAAIEEIIAAERKAEIEADNAAKMLLPTASEEVKEDVGEES